jgi:hypothetical protein
MPGGGLHWQGVLRGETREFQLGAGLKDQDRSIGKE